MVFEPAITTQDRLGITALAVLTLIAVIVTVKSLKAAGKFSKQATLRVATLGMFVLAGFGKLGADRLGAFCEVEFTDSEAIVRGVTSTVHLPLVPDNIVVVTGADVRLMSGTASATLPNAAWSLQELVVGADFLANEFEGRSR